MNESLKVSPQTRLKQLSETLAPLDSNSEVDRKKAEKIIVISMNDETTLVREAAIAYASQFLEPEFLGKLMADDENATLRNAALEAIERQGLYALPYLAELTKDSNAELALFATQIIGRLKEPSSVKILLPLLEHPDPNIVQTSVEALGQLHVREAVPSIVRLLKADMWIQFAAVQALGNIEDERAVEPLLELSENEILMEAAIEALGKIASPSCLKPLLDLFFQFDRVSLRDRVLLTLASVAERHSQANYISDLFSTQSLSDSQRDSLFDFLRAVISGPEHRMNPKVVLVNPVDDRTLLRGFGPLLRAAVTLIFSGRVEELYSEVLKKTSDPHCLKWVVQVSQRFPGCLNSAFQSLENHKDEDVRCGLLLVGDPTLISKSLLMRALRDPSPKVRTAAYATVGRAKLSEAVPLLMEKLKTGSDKELDSIVAALSQMPEEGLRPLVDSLDFSLSSEDIIRILKVLCRAKISSMDEKLLPFVEVENPLVRRLALESLAHSNREEVDWAIISKLDDPDERIRNEAVELLVQRKCKKAIPAFLAILEKDEPLRYHVIRALGRFKASEAVNPLQQLYSEAATHERIEIIMALVHIGDASSIGFLKERVHESDREIRRASVYGLARMISKEEDQILLQFLSDEDWYIRNEVAWGLGRLGNEKNRSMILSLLRDSEEIVSRTAREAVEKMGGSG